MADLGAWSTEQLVEKVGAADSVPGQNDDARCASTDQTVILSRVERSVRAGAAEQLAAVGGLARRQARRKHRACDEGHLISICPARLEPM